MASKRHGKKRKSGRRRRRVSGIHPGLKQTGMMVLGAGIGGIAGVFVNQAVKSSFTSMPTWIGGGANVAAGAALALFGPPSPLISGIATGLMASGAIFATNETFLSLPGISGVPANSGLMSARPTNSGNGFLNTTVGNYAGIPQNFVGNLSGEGTSVIGAIYRN